MHSVWTMPTGLEQGNKGVDDSFKTLPSRGKTIDNLNAPPLIYPLGDIRVPGTKENFMPFSCNTWKKLLTVFFHTTRDIRDSRCSGNKNFHGLSISMMWVHST
jgi:hypothetical protein